MGQIGNYTSIWSLNNDIQFLIKENSRLKKLMIFFTLLSFLCYFFLCFVNYTQAGRLNEQKKLLIVQQKQINQLILNAEYNELQK